MKIGLINTNLALGGAEKLISEMAPLMKEKGHDVEVILLSVASDVFSEKLKKQKIKIKYLSQSKNLINPLFIYKLYKELKNKDIIYTNAYHSQIWTALASLFLPKRIKMVTTEHNTYNRRRDIKLFYYIDKWMYSRYDKIISITEKVEEKLLEYLNQNKTEKFIVIENGINLKNIKRSKANKRNQFNYTLEDKLLVMVARFSGQKDQKTLIRAVKLLSQEYKLLLIGTGKLKNECEEVVRELNLDKRVKFLGFRSDIPELLKMCDISIISSNWEGFGLVAVEGMAAGLPIIASDVDGLNDVVRGAGILFEKGNEKQLAAKIEKLFESKEYFRVIKEKCKERAEIYSIKKMVSKYLDVYEKNRK